MADERPLPQALDSERVILGAILVSDDQITAASAKLDPEDFSLDHHQRIYKQMLLLSDMGSPITVTTVADQLIRRGELDSIGGLSYLSDLLTGVPERIKIQGDLRIVKEKARLRRLVFTGQHLVNRAMVEEFDSAELIASASEALLDMGGAEAATEARSPADIVHAYRGGIEEFMNPARRTPGIPTGYLRFDDMTGGLRPGEFIIIAARPGVGKSSFARNLGQFIACRQKKLVVIFTLEMSQESIIQAMMCSLARVDSQKYRLGYLNSDERLQLNAAFGELTEAPLLVDETANLTVPDFRSRIAKIQKRHGTVGLAIIDYLQLMASKGKTESRVQEVSAQTRGLKLAAKELGIPIVALSQLSRAVESRKGDHRPQLSDLRDSGTIEQDADLVGFLYRRELYERDKQEFHGLAELILAKNRSGPTGTVNLVWLANLTKFENRAEEYSVYEEERAV